MRYQFLIITLALAACSCTEKPVEQMPAETPATVAKPSADETLEKLRKFKSSLERDPLEDEFVLQELNRLNGELPDDQLSKVEKFAATPEAQTLVWPLTRLLVERGRVDAAAELIVNELSKVSENREYRLWKWWQFNFGERADYQMLNAEITEALLKQFAKGPEARKQVIAEVFGKKAEDAKLALEEFREMLPKAKQP